MLVAHWTSLGATQSLAGSSPQLLCVRLFADVQHSYFASYIESVSLPHAPVLVSIRLVTIPAIFISGKVALIAVMLTSLLHRP